MRLSRTFAVIAVANGLLVAVHTAGEKSHELDRYVNVLRKSAKDDADLAQKILRAAKTVEDRGLQTALYAKAYQFGTKKPAGYGTAARALEALLTAESDGKKGWLGKLIGFSRRLRLLPKGRPEAKETAADLTAMLVSQGDGSLARGEVTQAAMLYAEAVSLARRLDLPSRSEVESKLKRANAAKLIGQRAQRLKEALGRNPGDSASRMSLIRLHVVELDSPEDAKPLLDQSVSETWRTYVPLATMDVSKVAEPVCLELAKWYQGLARAATTFGKPGMLLRAQAYLERFLQLHGKKDASYLLAQASLESVQTDLKGFRIDPRAVSKAHKWTNLFDGTDLDGWIAPKDFPGEGAAGKVEIRRRAAILHRGRQCTGIHWARDFPKTDYEVMIEALPVAGEGSFDIVFPVGRERCALKIGGWGGTIVGLDHVDGKSAQDNVTTRKVRVKLGRPYCVRLRVTEEKVEAWVNQEKAVDLPRAGHKFTVWMTHSAAKSLGVVSANTDVAVRKIAVRRLGAAAKHAEPPPVTPIAGARGEWIVMSWAPPRKGRADIWLFTPDGRKRVNITNEPRSTDMQPMFSPDGRKIAFCREGGSRERSGIYVCETNGKNVRQLAAPKDKEQMRSPVWVSNSLVYFSYWTYYPKLDRRMNEVWAVSIDGKTKRRVFVPRETVKQGDVVVTDFSPDRKALLAVAQAGGWAPCLDVYMIDLRGSRIIPVYEDKPDDYRDICALWSPDGTMIAWCHFFTKGANKDPEYFGVAMARPSGTRSWVIGMQKERNEFVMPLAWSPIGTHLLCARIHRVPRRPGCTATLFLMDHRLRSARTVCKLENWDWSQIGSAGRYADWTKVPADIQIPTSSAP